VWCVCVCVSVGGVSVLVCVCMCVCVLVWCGGYVWYVCVPVSKFRCQQGTPDPAGCRLLVWELKTKPGASRGAAGTLLRAIPQSRQCVLFWLFF